MNKALTHEQLEYLELLTLEWYDRLMKYAYRFVGYQEHLRSDAEDAVQITLMKAVVEVDQLIQHENPAGWLKKSLHYTLLNLRRNSRNRDCVPVAEIRDTDGIMFRSESCPLWPYSEEPTLADVREMARRVLTHGELQTFNDYFLNGYSMDQTARLEHQPSSTIRGRISRIRRKLKRHPL